MIRPLRRSALSSRFVFLGLTMIAGACGAQVARADTINLLASADASVRLSSASGVNSTNSETNYGTEQILRVNYSTTSPVSNAKAYMRFDLTGISAASITGATLSLNTATAGYVADNVFNIYGLRDAYAGADATGNGSTLDDVDIHGETWPENVIDWNSAPANQLTTGGGALAPADRNKFTSDAILLGQVTVSADAPLNTNVTFSGTNLQTFLRGDSDHLVTLMISNNTESIFSFLSREAVDENGVSGYGPKLTFQAQVETTPEPSTWAMMALGVATLGLLVGKRKRS